MCILKAVDDHQEAGRGRGLTNRDHWGHEDRDDGGDERAELHVEFLGGLVVGIVGVSGCVESKVVEFYSI